METEDRLAEMRRLCGTDRVQTISDVPLVQSGCVYDSIQTMHLIV